MPSFLMTWYSSAIFLERSSFSYIWRISQIYLLLYLLIFFFFEIDHLSFSSYRIISYFPGKKYHFSWWYKKDHIQVQFFGKIIFLEHLQKQNMFFRAVWCNIPYFVDLTLQPRETRQQCWCYVSKKLLINH